MTEEIKTALGKRLDILEFQERKQGAYIYIESFTKADNEKDFLVAMDVAQRRTEGILHQCAADLGIILSHEVTTEDHSWEDQCVMIHIELSLT